MNDYMGIVWVIAVIGFVVLESLTVQFVSIWFSGGALCSLILFLIGRPISEQIIGFAVASAVLLLLTRPFVRKMTEKTKTNTNADSLIGKKEVITKATDGFGDGGEVKVEGKFWTVKGCDGEIFSEGDTVVVEKIEGVKLVVRK